MARDIGLDGVHRTYRSWRPLPWFLSWREGLEEDQGWRLVGVEKVRDVRNCYCNWYGKSLPRDVAKGFTSFVAALGPAALTGLPLGEHSHISIELGFVLLDEPDTGRKSNEVPGMQTAVVLPRFLFCALFWATVLSRIPRWWTDGTPWRLTVD